MKLKTWKNEFEVGIDVIARLDTFFYFGTVVSSIPEREGCLVSFQDHADPIFVPWHRLKRQ